LWIDLSKPTWQLNESFIIVPIQRPFASSALPLLYFGKEQKSSIVGAQVRMRNLYVEAVQPVDLNKNTSWFQYPGVWTIYIFILFFSWLVVLSLLGCTAGTAWTIVHLAHFAVTYHFFHWKKGTPFSEDQGMYNKLTWWEQMDNGKQLTRNRKFLTVVPVVLYLIASHTTDYRNPWLFLNTIAVLVLVIAKFPNMHKVRILGINADYPIWQVILLEQYSHVLFILHSLSAFSPWIVEQTFLCRGQLFSFWLLNMSKFQVCTWMSMACWCYHIFFNKLFWH